MQAMQEVITGPLQRHIVSLYDGTDTLGHVLCCTTMPIGNISLGRRRDFLRRAGSTWHSELSVSGRILPVFYPRVL